MLCVSNLKKSYATNTLFEDVSFIINPQERVGLVGRNGHGKSTLLKLILGLEQADSGQITFSKGYKIGYLSQHLNFEEKTILDEVSLALPLLDGSWKETYKAEALLHGLGFHDEDFTKSPSAFSGGFQIRLNLAKLLLSEPNLLLLDEPTNYLDIVSIRWLKRFLIDFSGEALLITHEREFMDSVTTHTMGIHRGKVRKIEGPSDKLYSILTEEEHIHEKTRVGEEKKRKHIEDYVNRFRAKASKAKSVQSKIKLLDKMEVKEELAEIQQLDFSFSYANFPGKWPMTIEDLSFSYDGKTNIIPKISFSVSKNDRIAVIGQNGKGKTTLLNILAQELKPSNGSVKLNENTSIGYFGQTNINRLDLNNTIESEVWSVAPVTSKTIIRSVCGAMMFEGDSALKQISVLSGGERSRVLLAKLILTPCNLLLLDEPTNHLDMYSVDSMNEAIENFDGAVIFVTHSENLIQRLATRLIIFDRNKVELFEGTYEDFLDQKGWEDEDEELSSTRNKTPKGAQKQNHKESKKIEAKIVKLETLIGELTSKLEKASYEKNMDQIFEFSKKLELTQKELEELYEKI